MKNFIGRFGQSIQGVLSGFDRLLFRGTLLGLAYVGGMIRFLNLNRVLRKQFGAYVERTTEHLEQASLRAAREQRRPVLYLPSSSVSKEDKARQIASADNVKEGLICVLRCVEPCSSFRVFGDRSTNHAELKSYRTKCMHLYHYMIDPVFGFMHVRLQTWFPFSVQIYVNGREWLARKMDRERIRYERRDNCFGWIDKVERAQELANRQITTPWEQELRRLSTIANPALHEILGRYRAEYYWSLWQSEWATDIMFKSPAALARIYPQFVMHAITSFGSGDVMRFLGQKVHGNFAGEIVSDFKHRPEGIRVRHSVEGNSVKMYDKQGSVFRIETTINRPAGFKVFRRKQGDPKGKRAWRGMRQGIADLKRRAEVSQLANVRYADAIAATDTSTPLGQLMQRIARPTKWKHKTVRGIRTWSSEDLKLIEAANRGEFCLNGFRNRDLQPFLFADPTEDPVERRRRSGYGTRLIRLLRAHRLVRKVAGSHRYKVTPNGREILSAVLSAQHVTLEALQKTA